MSKSTTFPFRINMNKQARPRHIIPAPYLLDAANILLLILIIAYPIQKYRDSYLYIDKQITTQKDKIAVLETSGRAIEKTLQGLYNKRLLISRLKSEGISWTEKLVCLSEFIPEQLWLTSVYTEKVMSQTKKTSIEEADQEGARIKAEKYLVIKGGALATETYLERIINFSRDLNKNTSFEKDFEAINLVSSTSFTTREGLNKTRFELRAKFKPE